MLFCVHRGYIIGVHRTGFGLVEADAMINLDLGRASRHPQLNSRSSAVTVPQGLILRASITRCVKTHRPARAANAGRMRATIRTCRTSRRVPLDLTNASATSTHRDSTKTRKTRDRAPQVVTRVPSAEKKHASVAMSGKTKRPSLKVGPLF